MKKKKFLVINPDYKILTFYAFDEFEAVYYAQAYDNHKYKTNQYLILKNYEVYRPYKD